MTFFKPQPKPKQQRELIVFNIPRIADATRATAETMISVRNWHEQMAEAASEKRDRLRHRAIAQRIQENLDGEGRLLHD